MATSLVARTVQVCGWLTLLGSSGCVLLTDKFPPLEPGDVTGVLVGTLPGETHRGVLPGGRVSLRYSNMQRTSGHDGRFMLRGLPKGDHVLLMSYDPDGDRVPNLAGVLQVPLRVDNNQERARVNLGQVELLKPATIRGTLVPPADDPTCVDISAMRVFIDDTDVLAMPDAGGHFVLRGLGEFSWKLVAAGGGALVTTDVAVKAGEELDLGNVAVVCGAAAGSLDVEVNTPQGVSALEQGLGARAARACNPLQECWDVQATPTETRFRFTGLPADGYSVEADVGQDFLRVHHEFVLVVAGANPRLLTLMATPSGGISLDLDGDGFPEMPDPPPPTCRDTCRLDLLTNALATCEQWDCDDDGDGQSDLDERPSADNPGCTCGPMGHEPGPTCERDPSRYDLDFDGTCDIFQRRSQTGSSSSGPGSSSSESGSSSAPSSSSGGGTSTFPSSSATSSVPSSSATSGPVPSSSGVVVASSSSGPAPVDTLIAGPFATGSITSLAVGDDFLAWVDGGKLWACLMTTTPPCLEIQQVGMTTTALRVGALKNSTVVWSEGSPTGGDAVLYQCSIAPGAQTCQTPTPIFTAGPPVAVPAPGFKGVFATNKDAQQGMAHLFLAIDDVAGGYVQTVWPETLAQGKFPPNGIFSLTFKDLSVEPASSNPLAGVAWVRSDSMGGVEGCNGLGCGGSTVFISNNAAERVAFATNRVFWVEGSGIVTCGRTDAVGGLCAAMPPAPFIIGVQPAIAVDNQRNLYWVRKEANGDATIMRRNVP